MKGDDYSNIRYNSTFVPKDLPLQELRKDFELELLAVDSSLDSFPQQERAPLARKR